METNDSMNCWDAWDRYVRKLASDTRGLSSVLASDVPLELRRRVAGAVQHALRGVEVLPEGLEPLVHLELAFVLRLAARKVARASEVEGWELVQRLASEGDEVLAFLEEDAPLWEAFVEKCMDRPARGRSVDQVAQEGDEQSALFQELSQWSQVYRAPRVEGDPRLVIKLRAYLRARAAQS